MEHLLQDGQRRDELDGLLVVDPYLGRTRLAWLGTGPTQASPAAVKGELEKLAYLRRLDAHTLDLGVEKIGTGINANDDLAWRDQGLGGRSSGKATPR